MTMFRFARRLALVVAADALVPASSVGQVGSNTLPVYSGAALPASVSSITSSNNVMSVVQTGNRAVINWESFSIGAASRLVINQPRGSLLINLAGGGPSQINGAISGIFNGNQYGSTNGAVWIINPSGLIFGSGSTVNVNSLLVSTLAPDFTDPAGVRFRAAPGTGSSSIALNGQVITSDKGSAGQADARTSPGSLVALSPTVTVGATASIQAQTDVRLIASDNLLLGIDPSGLIATTLQKSDASTLLNTQGAIRVADGTVELTSMGQRLAGMALLSLGGEVQASGLTNNIFLKAPFGNYSITGSAIPGPNGRLIISYLPDSEGAVTQQLIEVKAEAPNYQSLSTEGLIVDALPQDAGDVNNRQNPRRDPAPRPVLGSSPSAPAAPTRTVTSTQSPEAPSTSPAAAPVPAPEPTP
ncbi:MAG: filamentous hemagglutinin N-terminal domain-containing protein, partial [Betaproteobacteria bacterium]|nr:filamentous hemagglutinin N-terminal domain-containing protein [Betaproteobacteria bacterium]